MIEIPNWAQVIIDAHKAVAGSAVSHAGRLKSDRYFVWQEDFLDQDDVSDDEHDSEAVSGSTDLYTKREFDPWIRQIEAEFKKDDRILWSKDGMTFEPDTGFFHFSWEWTVIV